MKTTLDIDDHLYREAKVVAALTGRRMKDLVNEGLQYAVKMSGQTMNFRSPMPKMKLPLIPAASEKSKITSEQIYDLETTADLDRL